MEPLLIAAKVAMTLFIFGGWLLLLAWITALSHDWALDIGFSRHRHAHRTRKITIFAGRVSVFVIAIAAVCVVWS